MEGERTAMHADGGDGNEFPEFFEVKAERFEGFVNIPAGQGQVFVMVADFMAEDARCLLHAGGCE